MLIMFTIFLMVAICCPAQMLILVAGSAPAAKTTNGTLKGPVQATERSDNRPLLANLTLGSHPEPKSANLSVAANQLVAGLQQQAHLPPRVNLSVVTAKESLSPKQSTSANGSIQSFGEQGSASLLRPSFLRHLLATTGSRKQPASPRPEEEEEEEEVTQTIVMPIGPDESAQGELKESPQSSSSRLHTREQRLLASKFHEAGIQPKPEASLRLTSTEIRGLLNDREAPEFYRERELAGDGVLVGEERRLRTAASMGGSPYWHNTGMGPMPYGAGGPASDLYNQRLVHSATEDPSLDQMGFHHRFGSQQGFGGAGDEMVGAMNHHGSAGRLMQSPNEYSELSSSAGVGDFGAGGQERGYGPFAGADHSSSHSGLLRAGSGEFGPGSSMGSHAGYESAAFNDPHGLGGSSGYGNGFSNSPMLDRHSSELYGQGHTAHGGLSDMMRGSMHNAGGRLAFAGSHNPAEFSSGMPFGGGDEYTSRFGQLSQMPFDHRGFATQNSMMMRGNSMMSNSMQDAGASAQRDSIDGGTKLMPLSPIVPVAEEVTSPNSVSFDRESDSSMEKGASKSENHQFSVSHQQQAPQIHESLDDDAADPGDSGDDAEGNQFDSPAQSAYNDHSNSMLQENGMGDETIATTVASIDKENQSQNPTKNGPSLVLNVPPPTGDGSSDPFRQFVEFSRVGSAGYLAPARLDSDHKAIRQKLLKKMMNNFVSSSNQGQSKASKQHQPFDNPAHAGKYIID